jgi:hypothetical protein
MRAEWKAYLESLAADVEFLHRDELAQRYGLADVPLPAVLLKQGERLVEWIGAGEINRCRSLADLEGLISLRLASLPD